MVAACKEAAGVRAAWARLVRAPGRFWMSGFRCLTWAAWSILIGWLSAGPLEAQSMPGGGMRNAASGPSPSRLNTPDFRSRLIKQGGPQYGAPGVQKLVAAVRIVGNDTVPETTIQGLLRTRPDRAFDPEVLQADVRRLAAKGLFRDVRTFTDETPDGVIVTFEVFERPTIRYVKFLGNRGVTDKVLLRESSLKTGDALNQYAVDEARRKVEEFYHSRGFSKTQVSIFEGDRPQDRGVVFVIGEGKMERILGVEFVGNSIASDGRLKTQIQSKPGFLWYFFRGKVNRAKIDEDVDRLTAYYRSLGYFRARIGRELVYSESGKWLNLRFIIDEGPRYQIRNVTVEGNTIFADESLMEQLQLQSAEHFNLAKMNRDVNSLRELYGSQGYIFADIQADPRFLLEEPGKMDLVYSIQEGDLFRVGKINVHIAGEFPHTKRSVVLNRISLRPGDTIDLTEVEASERRLKSSNLFEVNPAQGNPPRVVIRPPELDESEVLGSRAGSGGGTYRGQDPNPTPTRRPLPPRGSRYTDGDVQRR